MQSKSSRKSPVTLKFELLAATEMHRNFGLASAAEPNSHSWDGREIDESEEPKKAQLSIHTSSKPNARVTKERAS
jgi:hypothetical protein